MLTPYLGLFYQSFYSFPHDNLLFVLKLKLTKKRLTYKTTGLNNLIFMQFGIKGGWGVVSGQPKCFLRILSLDWSGGMWPQIFKPIVCLYRRKFLFVTSRQFKHSWFVNLCNCKAIEVFHKNWKHFFTFVTFSAKCVETFLKLNSNYWC